MDEKRQLEERNKELNCLYRTDIVLTEEEDLFKILKDLCQIICDAFLYPSLARVKIQYLDFIVCSPYFSTEKDVLQTSIFEEGKPSGQISVYYSVNPNNGLFPFLPEEKKLLDSVGKRLSNFLTLRKASCFLAKDRQNQFTIVRQDICNKAVDTIEFKEFGIKSIYLIGSVKNFTSGIGSDIDLIVHYDGKLENAKRIEIWFKAWSASILTNSIYEQNIKIKGDLFDLHFITNEDTQLKNSFAVMIDSVYNNAKLIKNETHDKSNTR